jgi:hypothetical protein
MTPRLTGRLTVGRNVTSTSDTNFGNFRILIELYSSCVTCAVTGKMYSRPELARWHMHFIYGLADGTAMVTRHLHQERYPGRTF